MMLYCTTWGTWSRDRAGRVKWADNPDEPEGEGWELVGSAVDDGVLFWFWRREQRVEQLCGAEGREEVQP
ncbi:MAG: hypothetical protein GVY18_03635 [Bacteroidetes bacterium]|jgi:hypothetical protein|nr:hypothetical protein [Bacteroidota bacterium]